MPPIARTVVLLLLGASPACLTAQTVAQDGAAYRRGRPLGEVTGQAYGPPRVKLPPGTPSAESHDVRPAVYASVSPLSDGPLPVPQALDGPAADGPQALPHQAEPQTNNRPASGLALPPPGGDSASTPAAGRRGAGNQKTSGLGGMPSLVTTACSLAVVLGLFFMFACVIRRAAPRGSMLLPSEVIEVLGRAPLANRQQIHLLRCGNKLLLVSATPTGVETLTELTDPEEVDRLAGLCRAAQPGSATHAFRHVLQQFSQQRRRLGLPPGSDDGDAQPVNAGIHHRQDRVSEGYDV